MKRRFQASVSTSLKATLALASLFVATGCAVSPLATGPRTADPLSGPAARLHNSQSHSKNNQWAHSKNNQWATDGLIALYRAAPIAEPASSATMTALLTPHALNSNSMLGLLPGSVPALAMPAPSGTWIAVDRTTNSVALMEGDQEVSRFKGEGLNRLPTGRYELLLKQRNPLWYAPEQYFTNRNMSVPPPGDRARFRRGALGEFVVYLNKETPIHCGPVWNEELGGVRLDEHDLSRLYYQVQVGTPVEIR